MCVVEEGMWDLQKWKCWGEEKGDLGRGLEAPVSASSL